jgi:DNA-binding transcriptional LysR family regulator
MEIRQLTTFRILAQTLNFSRTAEALDYVQSSVTAQIQALEEELGVRLFDRLGKRVALTDAGKRLQIYAEKILEQVNEARCAVTEDEIPTGTVTISAAESLCTYRLPLLLHRFRQCYPQTRLIFKPTNLCANLRRDVSEGLIDVAFIIDNVLPSQSLQYEQLDCNSLFILAAPDHHVAQLTQQNGYQIKGPELQGEHFLLTEQGCSYRTTLEYAFRESGIDAVTDLEFSSVEAIKQCTMAGMGLAFLPEYIVERELDEGKLVKLIWDKHAFSIGTHMIYHQGKWLSPAIRAFLEIARETLHKSPQQVA